MSDEARSSKLLALSVDVAAAAVSATAGGDPRDEAAFPVADDPVKSSIRDRGRAGVPDDNAGGNLRLASQRETIVRQRTIERR